MITIQLSHGEFMATVQTDAAPHPDLLDELTARCMKLFLDTQAALPDDTEAEG